jgi:hypothetical protein
MEDESIKKIINYNTIDESESYFTIDSEEGVTISLLQKKSI